MLVHGFLQQAAGRWPDRVAVIDGAERVAYAVLDAASDRTARLLVEAGVRPGDRVGLLASNSILYVRAFFAVLKAGGVCVPLNTASDARGLRAALADCGARALLVGPGFAGTAAEAARDLPDLAALLHAGPADPFAGLAAALVPLEEADALPAGPPGVRRIDLDRAAIIYTSGSTGRPRGAVLRHLNLVSNTRSIVEYLGLTHQDRVLCVLPFTYVYGQSLLLTHVSAGGSVAIENRFLFPQVAVESLAREEATGFAGVPSTFAILLDRTNIPGRALPHLRYVTQAGGPMPPELTRRLVAALPGAKVFVMFGATEASARLSYLPPEDLARKLGSVGVGIPNVELAVLRENGTRAAPGETGLVAARGSNVMEGYWNDPEETARVLVDGWLRTGDLGRMDEDGFLWIVGRSKEMIKSGAHRIHPQEIESALLEAPGVSMAAVIGVPDPLLGEAIRAFVVPRPGVTLDAADLIRFCHGRLPAFKVPRDVEIRADLPRSPSGKVLKAALA